MTSFDDFGMAQGWVLLRARSQVGQLEPGQTHIPNILVHGGSNGPFPGDRKNRATSAFIEVKEVQCFAGRLKNGFQKARSCCNCSALRWIHTR